MRPDRHEYRSFISYQVEIPDGIKLDLTAFLSLHDNARIQMTRGSPKQALNYLLEAERFVASDTSFEAWLWSWNFARFIRNAASRIAHGIDPSEYPMFEQLSNVPLLNLDIVWCFLETKSLSHLAEGDRRLLVAEQGFIRAYGENMERVRDVRA